MKINIVTIWQIKENLVQYLSVLFFLGYVMPLAVIISSYARILQISMKAGQKSRKSENGIKTKASSRDMKVTREPGYNHNNWIFTLYSRYTCMYVLRKIYQWQSSTTNGKAGDIIIVPFTDDTWFRITCVTWQYFYERMKNKFSNMHFGHLPEFNSLTIYHIFHGYYDL